MIRQLIKRNKIKIIVIGGITLVILYYFGDYNILSTIKEKLFKGDDKT
jgi:hypothetical protein